MGDVDIAVCVGCWLEQEMTRAFDKSGGNNWIGEGIWGGPKNESML